MHFFNTGGPCNPTYHYMLPATERLVNGDVHHLIAQQAYFVVHAPRQTGKTTAMLALARELTASGDYTAVMVSMEVGAAFPDDVAKGEAAILDSWRDDVEFQLPKELRPRQWPDAPGGQGIGSLLREWAESSPRPLVLLLDEIDALADEMLISVLRQLRVGYRRRPQSFPAALALIGLRDVRDYKVKSGGSERLNSPSPFNISVRALTIRDFSQAETEQLLRQHTAETGQPFTPAALARVFDLTQGQPWLVNALAKVAVEELVTERTIAVDVPAIDQAKELLIQRRQTHLDQLADKLREERVRKVMEPIMAGRALGDVPPDDIDYVVDLGICRWDIRGGLVVANPIYREVLPRTLSLTARASLPIIHPTWLTATGELDLARLLDAFLSFWRQHGQPLLRAVHYHEIAPHLVMMAYLDRVANGGGTLEREYAIGTDRMDLRLRYGDVRLGIELKVWRDGRPDPLTQGLAQIDSYLAGLGEESGWLVIFDQRSNLPEISERTTTEIAVTPAGRTVTVIRA